MRYMKKLVTAVLVYSACYLPFIAILQAVSGADFTAAYSIGGMIAVVELALSAIIKREEQKHERKDDSDGRY